MYKADIQTLQRWHEDHVRYQRRNRNVDHFITLLNAMKMEGDIYGTSVKFVERFDQLISDYEKIADNELKEGNVLFKSLVIGLKSGLGNYMSAAKQLREEADKLEACFKDSKFINDPS